MELTNYRGCNGIYVLKGFLYEKKEAHERHLRNGDITDMIFFYYGATENSAVFSEHGEYSFDLTYFRGTLPEKYRVLHCVSEFLKGNLELDYLINLARMLEHRQYALNDCEMQNVRSCIEYVKREHEKRPEAFKDDMWLTELFDDV